MAKTELTVLTVQPVTSSLQLHSVGLLYNFTIGGTIYTQGGEGGLTKFIAAAAEVIMHSG